jgi:MOSC domain-containing protein YiiM
MKNPFCPRPSYGDVNLLWKGTVVSIHVASSANEPTVSLNEARLVIGKGIEGDRYFHEKGYYSDRKGAHREVTLIEIEAIEALKRENGIELRPGDVRRNIVTRGVPLNHLVGREFRVGEVILRGIRLCEPCTHLEGLTQKGVLAGLIHRGGLRAQVVKEGTIGVGHPIEER